MKIPSHLWHLHDGMTIEGMRRIVSEMPDDIVERTNKANHMFPPNLGLNGYVFQWYIVNVYTQQEGRKDLSVCQVRQREAPEAGEVGKATCFASWYLEIEMETLFEACEAHLELNGLPASTKFWCCFYSFRQHHIAEDLPYLSACVAESFFPIVHSYVVVGVLRVFGNGERCAPAAAP